jgi:pyruvate dehydrogenase E1 component alpha subunit/2-oxoisovalerate dehydrogenase E1 component alpha subunit
MKRYPAFDPPEYVAFRPEPEVMAEYRATIQSDPRRRALIRGLKPAALLRLYEGMVRFRLHDITLKRWVRQGVISKAWLGTGEEAVTVGTTHALERGDFVGPMIRNAGACHEMGMPVAQMLKAYLGTADQITRGRDLHTGDPGRGVIPPNSFMGCLVPVFAGIGIAIRRRGGRHVALTYVGDGASRTAAFHEGFNFASVQRLPMIVVLQHNQVALGTATTRHSAGRMEDLHTAYGVPGLVCDGNNVLDTWAAARLLVDDGRRGKGPSILTALTFRMGGHATHDEAEARALFTADVFRRWGRRDPIGTYESWLVEDAPPLDGRRRSGAAARREANAGILAAAEARVIAEVEAAAEEALASKRDRMPEPADALRGVYAEAHPAREPGGDSFSVSRAAASSSRRRPSSRRRREASPR